MGTGYFADTSFWIALSSERDQYHARALAWSRLLTQARARIVTTEGVPWEWMNAFSGVTTRRLAAEGYRQCHGDPQVEVVAFSAEAVEASVRLYEARHDKGWSVTDCFSFVVAQQRGLRNALTTDRHFEQAGLRALMLEEPPAT